MKVVGGRPQYLSERFPRRLSRQLTFDTLVLLVGRAAADQIGYGQLSVEQSSTGESVATRHVERISDMVGVEGHKSAAVDDGGDGGLTVVVSVMPVVVAVVLGSLA
jgi:hypothetical protein